MRSSHRAEVLLVLAAGLGASAVYSVVDLVAKLTAKQALSQQTANLNTSQAPGRPYLDLTYQLLGIVFALVPAMLAIHLLNREPGDARGLLGLDARRPAFDGIAGAVLAAVIGIPGLGLVVAAEHLGISAQIVPASLPAVWWAIPVLVLSAAQNAVLEEVTMIGYLLNRFGEFGWGTWRSILTSAVIRGSYHLYQGFGGFIGNAIMGSIFGYFYHRTRRVLPLIIAHTILDVVSFVGYTLFKDHLSFLR